jgi:hypothetical protein
MSLPLTPIDLPASWSLPIPVSTPRANNVSDALSTLLGRPIAPETFEEQANAALDETNARIEGIRIDIAFTQPESRESAHAGDERAAAFPPSRRYHVRKLLARHLKRRDDEWVTSLDVRQTSDIAT